MYTITILRSSPKSQTSLKDMLDPKGSKLGPKWVQNGQSYIFRTVNLNFPKEDHKNSFYSKKSSKFSESLRKYKLNVDFRPKKGKFGPKRVQNWRG